MLSQILTWETQLLWHTPLFDIYQNQFRMNLIYLEDIFFEVGRSSKVSYKNYTNTERIGELLISLQLTRYWDNLPKWIGQARKRECGFEQIVFLCYFALVLKKSSAWNIIPKLICEITFIFFWPLHFLLILIKYTRVNTFCLS